MMKLRHVSRDIKLGREWNNGRFGLLLLNLGTAEPGRTVGAGGEG